MKDTELDPATLAWLDEYRELQEQKKALEERIEVARSHVENALGENEVGTFLGNPVIRWTRVFSSRFDTTKAKKLLSDEQINDCTVTMESRRFALVTEKNDD